MANRSKQNMVATTDSLVLIGRRIKKQREARGLTQDQVAAIIGNEYPAKMISRYENGKAEMGILTLITIANALGITPNDLIEPNLITNPQAAPIGYMTLSEEDRRSVDKHVTGLMLLEQQTTESERRM